MSHPFSNGKQLLNGRALTVWHRELTMFSSVLITQPFVIPTWQVDSPSASLTQIVLKLRAENISDHKKNKKKKKTQQPNVDCLLEISSQIQKKIEPHYSFVSYDGLSSWMNRYFKVSEGFFKVHCC